LLSGLHGIGDALGETIARPGPEHRPGAAHVRVGDHDLGPRPDVVLVDGTDQLRLVEVGQAAPGMAVHANPPSLQLGAHRPVEHQDRTGIAGRAELFEGTHA